MKTILYRLKKTFWILIIPVVIAILWQYTTKHGMVNRSILPEPAKVGDSLLKLIKSGKLWKHIASSFIRVIKGYMIGALAGMILGIAAAFSEKVSDLIRIPVGVLRPIPAIALIPFFILWMGIGEESKEAVIVFGSFWPVLLNTI